MSVVAKPNWRLEAPEEGRICWAIHWNPECRIVESAFRAKLCDGSWYRPNGLLIEELLDVSPVYWVPGDAFQCLADARADFAAQFA